MDEAQDVGEGHSAVGQFAARLHATHRWAVTGTPIGPHGLADIAGLLKTIAHPLAQHLPSLGEHFHGACLDSTVKWTKCCTLSSYLMHAEYMMWNH